MWTLSKLSIIIFLKFFISGIIFTFNNTLFKIAGLDYMDTILTRSLLQIALLTFLNYCQKNNYHFGLTKTQGLILIQAFCSAIMIFGSYNCLRFLPIGDAITIMFSSPLFTGNLLFHMLWFYFFLLSYYRFLVN